MRCLSEELAPAVSTANLVVLYPFACFAPCLTIAEVPFSESSRAPIAVIERFERSTTALFQLAEASSPPRSAHPRPSARKGQPEV